MGTGIGYDAKGRLITTTLLGPAAVSSPLTSSYGYAYTPADWTTAITTVVSGITTTQALTHDMLGRVLAASDSAGTAQGWSYDGNGNLLASVLNGQTTLYSYTASITPNELLTQTVLAGTPVTSVFGYDRNGDTTSVTTTLNTTTTLVYDSAARPLTLTALTPTTSTAVFLRYNAAGRRSADSLYRGTTFSYGAQFTYRGAELGQAVVFSGTTSYTDTDLYDGQGAPLELIRQTRVGGSLSTARYWYALDGRGDVVALTDSSGSVVDRYAYGVWGSLVSASEAVPRRLRYAGYWDDAELGWYWAGVRYYSPSVKRWLQPDPSQIDGVRTYVYVGDDPIDFKDPSGFAGGTPTPSPTATCHSGQSTSAAIDFHKKNRRWTGPDGIA